MSLVSVHFSPCQPVATSLPELDGCTRLLPGPLPIHSPGISQRDLITVQTLWCLISNFLQGLPISFRIKTNMLAVPCQPLHDLVPISPHCPASSPTAATLKLLSLPLGEDLSYLRAFVHAIFSAWKNLPSLPCLLVFDLHILVHMLIAQRNLLSPGWVQVPPSAQYNFTPLTSSWHLSCSLVICL